MRFRFCSDGDCPLWALAGLHALSSLPVPLFKKLLQNIVEDQPEDNIREILKDTSFASREECARAAAVIRWVLVQTHRGACSSVQLTRDLLVLGVARTHALALASAADATRDSYMANCQANGFMVNKVTDVTATPGPEGTVDTVKMTFFYDDIAGDHGTSEVLINKTQAQVLLGELKEAFKKMEELDL